MMIQKKIVSLSIAIAAFGTSVAAEAFECKICSDGKTMSNPNARYDFLSCLGLEDNLKEADDVACSDYFADPGKSWLNYPSFCGCQSSIAPAVCQLCDDGQELNLSKDLVPWEEQEDEYTCQSAAEIARHVKDPTACSWVASEKVKQLCCKSSSSAAAASPYTSAFSTLVFFSTVALATGIVLA